MVGQDLSDLVRRGFDFITQLDRIGGVNRQWITRIDNEVTDPKYGSIPWERPIDEYIKKGLIVLDKPPGPTSHEVVAWIKKMIGIEKAGHGGTLEPSPVVWGWAGRSEGYGCAASSSSQRH